MLSRSTYDKLLIKIPLAQTTRVGLGVQKVPFKIDGVVRLNCQFYDETGETFCLPHEPFMVSAAIDGNLFGMNTERRFRAVKREHDNYIHHREWK